MRIAAGASWVFQNAPIKPKGLKLRRHFPEFLTAFRYRRPALRTIAIHMHFGIEPTCVVERTSLNKSDPWHNGDVREDWRPTFWTEVPLNWLDAVARLVGIEGGVVSGVFNLKSSGVRASDWRPRHDKRYREA